ncbi:MAG TPA: hypothetical protein EYP56_16940 [Planctomycetaceae bacterium]|nr:hypothetical protein [Planctomycetaceae bacterium]HIQ23307.1 hypothetical protein [Planctomycetota bacterium]
MDELEVIDILAAHGVDDQVAALIVTGEPVLSLEPILPERAAGPERATEYTLLIDTLKEPWWFVKPSGPHTAAGLRCGLRKALHEKSGAESSAPLRNLATSCHLVMWVSVWADEKRQLNVAEVVPSLVTISAVLHERIAVVVDGVSSPDEWEAGYRGAMLDAPREHRLGQSIRGIHVRLEKLDIDIVGVNAEQLIGALFAAGYAHISFSRSLGITAPVDLRFIRSLQEPAPGEEG